MHKSEEVRKHCEEYRRDNGPDEDYRMLLSYAALLEALEELDESYRRFYGNPHGVNVLAERLRQRAEEILRRKG